MDSEALKMLLNGLRNVDLTNSFYNYHVHGVHYLCLGRNPGFTLKLYYFDPADVRLNNSGDLVAPHDHRYDFTTFVLQGTVLHSLFQETDDIRLGQRFYRHTHEGSGANAWLRDPEPVYLQTLYQTYEEPGGWYSVNTSEIHTIAPDVTPGAEPTILFLAQYERKKENTSTYLLEERRSLGRNRGLYLPMPLDMAERIKEEAIWATGAVPTASPR